MRVPRLSFRWAVTLGLVATLLLPVAVIGGSVLAAQAITALPSGAALRVDGVTVTTAALERRVHLLGALYGVRRPADPGQTGEFNRAIAHTVALRIVLDREIAARHLTVSDARANQLLAEFIAHGMNPPGQEAFVGLLRDVGASEADVVDELKRQEGIRQLVGQVTAQAAVPVGEAEVSGYYRSHPSEMTSPERRHLRNIVVAGPDDAAEVLAELQHGADFAAVAQRSSLDETTRSSGGDLGVLSADQLDAAYRGPAFSAAAGAVFGPVRTAQGSNVGQVVGVTPAVAAGYAEVHDQLAEWLRQRRIAQTWQAWLGQELARADVSYAEAYRPGNTGPISAGAMMPQ